MRVGSLVARYSDGEFQINAGTNSSMGRLKVYAMLGVCPYEQLNVNMEFSPIDEVSKGILILSDTPKSCVIFHPFNHHFILANDVFKEMSNLGLSIKPVETEEFRNIFAKTEEDPKKAALLTSMPAYKSDEEIFTIPKNNSYTMQILYRLGFSWSITTLDMSVAL